VYQEEEPFETHQQVCEWIREGHSILEERYKDDLDLEYSVWKDLKDACRDDPYLRRLITSLQKRDNEIEEWMTASGRKAIATDSSKVPASV